MNQTSLQKFNTSLVVALVLTAISYIVAASAGWMVTPDNPIKWVILAVEVGAVFVSYSCTYLCVVQSRWNYFMGVAASILLAISFWYAGYYASMALQFYLLPVMAYGYWRWREDTNTRPVSRITDDSWPWLVFYAFMMLSAYGAAYNFNLLADGNMPAIDTALFVGSVLAQFLMDNKKVENWAVWAVVNVVSIGAYFHAGLYLIALQFVFFLGNTIYGYLKWRDSIQKKEKYPILIRPTT